MQIVECVPNFSEGKDQKVIDQIVSSISSVPEVEVLHRTSDTDHNRSVITFIGPAKNVCEAAFQATKKASELIDITNQKGVHPRLGATDVIPLIPLKNITQKDLIPHAEALAKRITSELKIPTHLYEKAAQTELKKNLANIRLQKPSPDFNCNSPLKEAGETTVGVREILIAFNVNLKTNNLKAAKEIAKKIRQPYLKALGLELQSRNIVQVSMNLTNYKKVSPLKAFNLIQEEAQKLNTEILESELIGLIPKDALPENPEEKIKLKITKNQILNY
ncbi:glutamate formimidoyltransferase [Candidatus Peregrinibacteria bacterium CG10_big_fil_rev_8_21_14_0_10_36_19]|nr:MAG: glutamate formimidoyltransferase [Candidatus Peregrinibacteria bacterium CG10_big_fil_rev_8_21_14_0_10_36_19]